METTIIVSYLSQTNTVRLNVGTNVEIDLGIEAANELMLSLHSAIKTYEVMNETAKGN